MEKRCLIAIVAILIVITEVFAGCKKTPSPEAQTGIREEVYTGTSGLKMNFAKNMPPSRMYDTSSLNILLELENKGTSDLSGSKCMLYLSGFDENIIRGLDKEKQCAASLEGKSILNPEGGYSTQEFSTDLIYLPDYLDKLRQTIQVTACYEYQTTASPVVCIDPHLYEIGPIERACVVKDVLMGGGQGAPVAVTGVEVKMAGRNRVAFNIKVSNVGGGTPLHRGVSLFNECPYNINVKDYNVISYNVEMAGAYKIRCVPEIEGEPAIRLVDGKGTIYCTFGISGDAAYSTPLRITLDYSYIDSISKDIEIIKTPQ